jgi:hypothetical protein
MGALGGVTLAQGAKFLKDRNDERDIKMNILKIDKGDVMCGIDYKGQIIEIDPLVDVLESANEMFKNTKDVDMIKKGILMIAPDFPVAELRVSEVVPVLKGITKAIKESLKNEQSPAV